MDGIPGREPLLSVRELRVGFGSPGREVVHGVSLDVHEGEVVALVGESGSGKTVTALSVIGLLPERTTVTGSIRLEGRELLGLPAREMREVRGAQVALISQDPVASLNPVFTIGFQVMEAVRAHDRSLSAAAARGRAIDLLRLVEIPEPERRMRQYPHQLSGGQCQRVGIAMALASDPRLLIADEPTTALDVTIQAEILDTLRRLGKREGRGILLITHDMGVVAELADRVVVMRQGNLVETGASEQVFARPEAAYTRELLAAVPRIGTRGASDAVASDDLVLEVDGLIVEYGSRVRGRIRAVDDVHLRVRRGEIVGLVGESGSGKSTIGKAIIGVAPASAGRIAIEGVDVSSASPARRREIRRHVGVVFQNPALSLNPRYTAAETVSEPLALIAGQRGAALRERTTNLLASVGLEELADRYPHELSGGQRQRVAIARAVALDPSLLIADEPTSALDVSVQAQVLDVFRELQERLGFACLFISHDLAVVDELCDGVVVLSGGQVVERGPRERVLTEPQHPYTRRLLASAPVPDPVEQALRRAARQAA
jgi:peptide/nickel transport system ATP-binding protein